MTWLRRLIHRLFGPSRYHSQANEVQSRTLRVQRLTNELESYRRGRP
jgi:hypothetical protein